MKIFFIVLTTISIVQTKVFETTENKKVQNKFHHVRLILNGKCVEQTRNNIPILVNLINETYVFIS